MVPAFVGGLPGGMEFAVIFLMLVTFGLVAFVVVAGGRALFGSGGESADQTRVAELEAKVTELESQVVELQQRLDDGET